MEFLGLPPAGGETNIRREDMDTVTAQVFYIQLGFICNESLQMIHMQMKFMMMLFWIDDWYMSGVT